MPRRDDLHTILLLGSGPIVIGQGCEFDYSGTQAVRALREEGYRVVLVNSNPATIMTDPELADRTYIEPITPEWVERIIEKERPDALLPTMGGQTALNVALRLYDDGVLDRHGVELIGADARAIRMAEDREEFAEAMQRIGLAVPTGGFARSVEQAIEIVEATGYPAIIRPSFTLGGSGGGIAYNSDEFAEAVRHGLDLSPIHEVLIDRSVIGWKEFELEVVRDGADNVIVVCSIENVDPMGVHTGDSITVAPAQTLSDVEYQKMRDAAIAIIREIGVEAGGCNVQFALNPLDGEMLVVEMNPRVSRSSALASKATGFPIARVGAKLAVGYTLDELPNDITKTTPASFEPVLDYVVAKFPRFAFEKFPAEDDTLGVQMKAVGETMAIGRTFKQAWQKGIRGLEVDRDGWHVGAELRDDGLADDSLDALRAALRRPTPARPFQIKRALVAGMSVDEIHELTWIDPWFLEQLLELVVAEKRFAVEWEGAFEREGAADAAREASLRSGEAASAREGSAGSMREGSKASGGAVPGARSAPPRGNAAPPAGEAALPGERQRAASLLTMKRLGFSDSQLARLAGTDERALRELRWSLGIRPTYHMVDTCAGEFPAATPYLYSSYEAESEAPPSDRRKIVVLGSGPNRIGQGIEFDYCCVQAALALRDDGFETIMINSNPETVSTDFDISDKLYFEPLTVEDVLEIIDREQPEGVIVQLGGQTPLGLAGPLAALGVPILGTTVEAIDRAEDRDRFAALCAEIGATVPPNGMATSVDEAAAVAARIGYPVLLRPSYVIGGRAMEIVYDEPSLRSYFATAARAAPGRPVLIDRFLEDAFEADVDAISDGRDVVVAGVMQHIEDAGVHSGDSACVLPPYLLKDAEIAEIRRLTRRFASALGVVGLINVQFAIRNGIVYVLEVNPRASRTVPFVSKACGFALARAAARVMAGRSLHDAGLPILADPDSDLASALGRAVAVKEAVFPFNKFNVDILLGPEMRSTGEVMGLDESFGMAFAKSQIAAGMELPIEGVVAVTVNQADKPTVTPIMRRFHELGFRILATDGTCRYLRSRGVPAERIFKVGEGRPDLVDRMISGEISFLINTPLGKKSQYDDYAMRRAAIVHRIPYCTTMSAASAACDAVIALRSRRRTVVSLQERAGLVETEPLSGSAAR
ncbi:MAG TPA: carbamoyl-phosphate synthase large subunit [Longimicrobiales bacterium]|nr:carbamoyl-phosphate synthase large subunit [Longimicrobiales bacterium]